MRGEVETPIAVGAAAPPDQSRLRRKPAGYGGATARHPPIHPTAVTGEKGPFAGQGAATPTFRLRAGLWHNQCQIPG